VSTTGSNLVPTTEAKTIPSRIIRFRQRYQVQTSIGLAILTALTFIAAEVVPAFNKWILTSGVLQYVTLVVVTDLAATVCRQHWPPSARLVRNQDESMSQLLQAVVECRADGADLLEYAGQTTLPLIREISRQGVPVRILIKHPETIAGLQRQRSVTTLDTLYNSIFDNYTGRFEIRCYRAPYTLRGRRLGKTLLELGWLTPDPKRQMAYGHANPSIIVDLASSSHDHLRSFFDRTFEDLWNAEGTEDGLAVLKGLHTGDVAVLSLEARHPER
jgi:hypothetical protein